jgi:hypothetical protein
MFINSRIVFTFYLRSKGGVVPLPPSVHIQPRWYEDQYMQYISSTYFFHLVTIYKNYGRVPYSYHNPSWDGLKM